MFEFAKCKQFNFKTNCKYFKLENVMLFHNMVTKLASDSYDLRKIFARLEILVSMCRRRRHFNFELAHQRKSQAFFCNLKIIVHIA